jgi:predicted RNase H-like HicB family nuclease
MKAYYGQHTATGKWYALTELPHAEQWGETKEEAWKKLKQYLQKHHGLTLTQMEPFPMPNQPGAPESGGKI